MFQNLVPTSTEMGDAQNAFWDDTDAVIRSGEVASGGPLARLARTEIAAAPEAETKLEQSLRESCETFPIVHQIVCTSLIVSQTFLMIVTANYLTVNESSQFL